MKTLIIAGTYRHTSQQIELNGIRHTVHYNVTLFGQTKEQPLMVYIGSIDREMNGFDELQQVARDMYAKYFQTDLFNIISMEVLNESNIHFTNL